MEALLVVDVQNDFVPGGALAVPDGDAVAGCVNRLAARFDLVVATQDWHPHGHGSFASSHPGQSVGDRIELAGLEQILWPDHCVQGTRGAEFVAAFDTSAVDAVFRKGTHPDIDSYSAFFDNAHRKSTGLDGWLAEHGVDGVTIVGLATDYCVSFTAHDARGLGLRTRVVLEGCRGVELSPGDIVAAVDRMRHEGVEVVETLAD